MREHVGKDQLVNSLAPIQCYLNPFAPTAPETARKKQWCFKKSNLCETTNLSFAGNLA